MSFSPRARPDTVHLPFSDVDVTDSYRDVEASSNNASSPRHRHPQGDTPLVRRAPGSIASSTTSPSRFGRSSSRGGRSAGAGEQDNSERIRSNLDKLLDLLDQEDAHAQEHAGDSLLRSAGGVERSRMSTPPPPPPPLRATSEVRSEKLPHSAPFDGRPSFGEAWSRARSDAPPQETFTSFSDTTYAGPQPPPPPADYSAARPPLSARGSTALELLQRMNGFEKEHQQQRSRLPDSPSPRPGSVAALRSTDASRSLAQDDSAAATNGLASEFSRMAVQDDDSAVRMQAREASGTAPPPTHRKSNASLDSITRVAEAALQEFDEIVSETTQHDGRPASRLRTAPSPARTASATQQDYAPTAQYEHAQATGLDHSPEQVNQQLIQELREAQDYIAYLQEELRSIGDVVGQLREEPDDAQNGPPRARATPAAQDWTAVAQGTQHAAFDILQHTFAMLPSLSDASTPLDSVARALGFVRRMDELVQRPGARRRDEDIFDERNLEAMLRRVEGFVGRPG